MRIEPTESTADPRRDRADRPWIAPVFALTLGLSAFLLFAVQPMAAKMVLPLLGGSASVWITCSLFFQAALLGGYLYAYGLDRGLKPVARLIVHAGLFGLTLWFLPPDLRPMGPDEAAPPLADPRLWLLARLAGRLGLPLLLVAASAPLLQLWFAGRQGREADPYWLYVASNAGSLIALVAYPLVIEPRWSLGQQSRMWSLGHLALGMGLAICGVLAVARRDHPDNEITPQPRGRVEPRDWFRWAALAFVPSSLLLGVTLHLTTDIAPMPLLWVVPLALYLLSFIITFSRRPLFGVAWSGRWYLRALMLLVPVMMAGWTWMIWLPLHLATFLLAALLCHGELASRRPPASHLTAFYLALAVGGAAGGLFNALLAPTLFDRVVEYPLGLVLACLAVPGVWERGSSWRSLVVPVVIFVALAPVLADPAGLGESGLGVLLVILGSGLSVLAASRAQRQPRSFAATVAALMLASGLSPGVGGRVIHRERNFYGAITIKDDPAAGVRRLFHGSTLHGQQSLDPARRGEPMTYFTREGPFGQILADYEASDAPRRVAIVGLGAGSMAAYARPDQTWTFYEIDPAVARIAGDPHWFTFLADCAASRADIVLGDARLKLRDAPDHSLGLLVLDAFSSDAPPVHLLTREAFELYGRKLAPNGRLAVNLTNRYLDLSTIVARLAEGASLRGRIRYDTSPVAPQAPDGRLGSIWCVLIPESTDFGDFDRDTRWSPLPPAVDGPPWTDDSTDLLGPMLARIRDRRAQKNTTGKVPVVPEKGP